MSIRRSTISKACLSFAAAAVILVPMASQAAPSKPSVRGPAATSSIPASLAGSATEKVGFVWHAEGWQNYECRVKGAGFAWEFTGPEAVLFNEIGNLVGSHGVGPFWSSVDGSSVVGTVKVRADAPQATDIPWLLLTTKATDKPGRMSSVTSIQRVNTRGGIVPSSGCASAGDVSKKSAVDYGADYVFLTAR